MSYANLIAETSPDSYFPMVIRDSSGNPVDILADTTSVLSGSSSVSQESQYLNKFININAGETLTVVASPTLYSIPTTLSFWFSAERSTFNEKIFSYGSETEGFSISISDDETTREAIFSFPGTSDINTPIESENPVNFTIINSSSGIDVSINGAPTIFTPTFTIDDSENIVLGNESSTIGIKIGEIFAKNSELTLPEIEIIYEIGYFGREKVTFDSNSSISLSDGEQDILQTAWQPYTRISAKQ